MQSRCVLPVSIKINKEDSSSTKTVAMFAGNWMSTGELSILAGIPQKEVIGLKLKEEVEFGLNIDANADRETITIGKLVRSGEPIDMPVSFPRDQLDKHVFVCGVTGSGKTNTCKGILMKSKLPFMVIEPAKTEYRSMKNSKEFGDLLVFTLGNDNVAPFRMNPFEFLRGENITSRVDMIKANIEAAFDMEAAIPQIIESAIYKAYESYGWDIRTSTNSRYPDPFADGVFAFPTLEDVVRFTKSVSKEQGFDQRLENDYIGSINARLQGLLVGAKGMMLNCRRSIDFDALLDRRVVLELEEIRDSSQKSLVMGFVLISLLEAIKHRFAKDGKPHCHITLIEEAHRLMSKYEPGDNPNKKHGGRDFFRHAGGDTKVRRIHDHSGSDT